MNVRRFLQAGAVWGWPQLGDPLTEARARYTVTGAPTIVESPWGLAMSFDGTNDYVTLKDSEEFLLRFDNGTQDFSIAAWVRTDTAGTQFIFDKRDGNGDGWLFFQDASSFISLILDNVTVVGATEINDGLWHSVIASIDRSGNGQMYLDGVPDGAAVAINGNVMATTVLPRIGARSFTAAVTHWTGDLAGMVIWDRTLAAEEALALATGRAF